MQLAAAPGMRGLQLLRQEQELGLGQGQEQGEAALLSHLPLLRAAVTSATSSWWQMAMEARRCPAWLPPSCQTWS